MNKEAPLEIRIQAYENTHSFFTDAFINTAKAIKAYEAATPNATMLNDALLHGLYLRVGLLNQHRELCKEAILELAKDLANP